MTTGAPPRHAPAPAGGTRRGLDTRPDAAAFLTAAGPSPCAYAVRLETLALPDPLAPCPVAWAPLTDFWSLTSI
jgi:hypothetical protein